MTIDEYTEDALVNRGDPDPTTKSQLSDELSEDNEAEAEGRDGKKRSLKKSLSKSKIKDKMRKVVGKSTESSPSIQDRLLEKLLQQVIPVEDMNNRRRATSPSTADSYTQRPGFNITTMSNNFRRFNSRIGVVFLFQARMTRMLSWKTTSHTLSFLVVYTFVCLEPYLVSIIPLVLLMLGVLVPSFIARHPAPPSTSTYNYLMTGPPIAPAPTVKPVKELSKDFFRNMRDLQNSMDDFSRVHDQILSTLTPTTNFSDEALSSAIFLFIYVAAAVMFLASHLIPWRFLFLIAGWFITVAGHPAIQKTIVITHKEHIIPQQERAKSWLDAWIAHDIILDSEPETREVEIFELQKLSSAGEWESWIFSPSPHDPMSPSRIADERPKGTRFFEDVQAPNGWEWSGKKWALDLWSKEWVEERIITGVEIETEGERWVYDIEYETSGKGGPVESPTRKGKKQLPSWEDGSVNRSRGQWRRRRWVRIVKRKTLSRNTDTKRLG